MERSKKIVEEVKIHPGVVIGASLLLGAGGTLLYALTARAAPPGEFEVSDLVISPEVVSVGQPVTISVLVINVGTETGSKTVILEVNGEMAEQIVTLEPGESQVVSFEVTPEIVKAYSVSVDGLYGSFEATAVGVAAYSVVLGVSNMTPEVDELISWWVDITNIGTALGAPEIQWYINGVLVRTTPASLIGPGDSQRKYGYAFRLDTPGDHALAVIVNGAADSVTITVQEAAVADIKVEDIVISPSEVYVGETVIISVRATNYGTVTGSKTIICTVS